MTRKLRFDETVPLPPGAIVTAALGATAGTTLTDVDKGKALKRGTNHNYVLAADGDDLEGRLEAIAVGLVNDGFNHGSVLRGLPGIYMTAVNAGAGAIAVGATVVCAAQTAQGTAQTVAPYPKVKAGAGVLFKWRVIELWDGAGAVGAQILLERI